jgi:anti-sigma B factor antagonist
MEFTQAQHGSVTVIQLKGNLLGGPDAATLNKNLHALIGQGTHQVVIDLAGVEFMNSSGLGMLIGSASTMKSAGGALKLANVSKKILGLIKITKLTAVFETFDSVEAAVGSFKK